MSSQYRGGSSRGGASRGGRSGPSSYGPLEITEVGVFLHPSEGTLVCRSSIEKVPYFNAPIYLQNKSQIGKIDEILGPINEVYFSVKLDEGINFNSLEKETKVYIGTDKLLPLARFTSPLTRSKTNITRPKSGSRPPPSRGGFRGGPRGGGGFRGGSSRGGGGFRGGASRGGPRGGGRGRY